MIIRKRSLVSGQVNEMDLQITQEQLNRWYEGELVQNAFPNLSADEREFLISGITPEEWESMFGE